MIWIERGEHREQIPLEKLQEWTGVKHEPALHFASLSLLQKIVHQGIQLEKKGELTLQQVWLGRYFRQEILFPKTPPISIRWINDQIGWGVFAEQKIPQMSFISEYSGLVRKRTKEDQKNSYCFEYVIALGMETPYNVDARSGGGIARYINHSSDGNLEAALATTDGITHIILYAKKAIEQGEQLLYDYGPDYWKSRSLLMPL